MAELLADILPGDADGRSARDIAGLDQFIHDFLCRVDRDGKTKPLIIADAKLCRGDADHLTVFVDERAARIAGVDGHAGLDEAHDAVIDRDVAVDGRDDAVGHGVCKFHAARRTDGISGFADLEGIGITKLGRSQCAFRGDLDHGEVGLLIIPDDLRRKRGSIGEEYGNIAHRLAGVFVKDDMRVGDDVSVRRHHDTRTGGNRLTGAVCRLDCNDGVIELFVDILARHHAVRRRRLAVVRGCFCNAEDREVLVLSGRCA